MKKLAIASIGAFLIILYFFVYNEEWEWNIPMQNLIVNCVCGCIN